MNIVKHSDHFNIGLHVIEGFHDTINCITMPGLSPGQYEIYLNDTASEIQKLASFLHEMVHVYNHDFEKSDNVSEIEARTRLQLLKALELIKEESEV